MKNNEIVIILKKMIGYCDDVLSFLQQFENSYETYLANKIVQYACHICIVQIGELSIRLSDEFKDNHKDIPWRVIRAARNYHAHDYENVTQSVMWNTLTEDIPELRTKLQGILESEVLSLEESGSD